ncbi:contact-dependent growth inhibition system immunity protein [Micromonospora sp. CPCC 205556]|uniref:contact-dependent growth inhibition system immunity protein n=1 Tax=Micromonospora sp. CPCC 205556 TaxID=3122398 RepID=UPI002FF2EE98
MTTIERIEGADWGPPEPDSTFLVRRCTELRRKPLTQFTVEDLRIMLGQQIAVPILLPLAVEVLARDPLAESDFYPGDLLGSVLRLPAAAWSTMPQERQRLTAAVTAMDLDEADLPQDVRDAVVSVRQASA